MLKISHLRLLFYAPNERNYLERCKKIENSKIIERFYNDGTYYLSKYTKIGGIKTITQNMEVSFEMRIENMDLCDVDGYIGVLRIVGVGWSVGWFYFGIKKSSEESKFCIYHKQENGLGRHDNIRIQKPIIYAKNWQKEFLLKF